MWYEFSYTRGKGWGVDDVYPDAVLLLVSELGEGDMPRGQKTTQDSAGVDSREGEVRKTESIQGHVLCELSVLENKNIPPLSKMISMMGKCYQSE